MTEAGEVRLSETTRLEAFSDGVFAIAVTLLVLDIKVPQLSVENPSLWTALIHDWSSVAAYVLSFLTIGIMWMNHHNVFKYIGKSDHNLRLMHVIFLMCISFLPYPTSLVASFIRDPENLRTAVVVYAATTVAIALMYNAIWWYAMRRPALLANHVDMQGMRTLGRRYLIGPVSYLMAVAVAFVSPAAALAWMGLLAIMYSLPESRQP